MKEIKKEKVIEEVIGYEAADGKIFRTKEECEKYEDTAEFIIEQDFRSVIQNHNLITENKLYENYGYGSEEYDYAVIDIKDANVLEIVNRFFKLKGIELVPAERIGQKVLVEVGGLYIDWARKSNPMTIDEIVHQFIKDMSKIYEEEYTLPEIEKSKAAYMLKNAIEYYDNEAYDVSDLINKVREIYEMIK